MPEITIPQAALKKSDLTEPPNIADLSADLQELTLKRLDYGEQTHTTHSLELAAEWRGVMIHDGYDERHDPIEVVEPKGQRACHFVNISDHCDTDLIAELAQNGRGTRAQFASYDGLVAFTLLGIFQGISKQLWEVPKYLEKHKVPASEKIAKEDLPALTIF